MIPKGIKQLIVNKTDYVATVNENKRLKATLERIRERCAKIETGYPSFHLARGIMDMIDEATR